MECLSHVPEIVDLRACPESIPAVAAWLFEAFHTFSPGLAELDFARQLEDSCADEGMPCSLVAIQDGRPVGTASVVESDLHQRVQYSPWLSCVYVVPGMRGCGVGSRLVERAMQVASRLGADRMFLYTCSAQNLYQQLGWSVLERLVHHGTWVSVMQKQLRIRGDTSGSRS